MIKFNNRILLSLLWLILSISFGIWWLMLGLRQAESISELKKEIGGDVAVHRLDELNRMSRMIKLEGSVFLVLLTIGGGTIVWFSIKDLQRTKLIKDFFSTVTHEMKTPLASLRLQVESLEEDIQDPHSKKILNRLISDSKRLELQMDKALHLASINRSEILFIEKTSLNEIIKSLKIDYPIIHLDSKTNFFVKSDKRALEGIFKNLIENSINHGKANKIIFSISPISDIINISVQDNGNGFKGDFKKLGTAFLRHSTTSGSGIGIYLVQKLIEKMKGQVQFQNNEIGFLVTIQLPAWENTEKLL